MRESWPPLTLLPNLRAVPFFGHGGQQGGDVGLTFDGGFTRLQVDLDVLHSGNALEGLGHGGLAVPAGHAADVEFSVHSQILYPIQEGVKIGSTLMKPSKEQNDRLKDILDLISAEIRPMLPLNPSGGIWRQG